MAMKRNMNMKINMSMPTSTTMKRSMSIKINTSMPTSTTMKRSMSIKINTSMPTSTTMKRSMSIKHKHEHAAEDKTSHADIASYSFSCDNLRGLKYLKLIFSISFFRTRIDKGGMGQ